MNLFDLTGKKALVTGSSRGIGRALAEALIDAGADVVVNGSSARIFQTAQQITPTAGQRVIPIQADLSRRDEVKRLFDESVGKLGGLDILFVNHGIQRRHDAADFPEEDWDQVIEVNLTSGFLLNQLAGRTMLAQGHGKIINIASLISVVGGVRIPAYAASKGGIAQVTKALSNEWAGQGVTVNAIIPGFIRTELTASLANHPEGANMLNRIPIGRMGVPDDLKGVAIFLAAPASDYISGAIIPVDGGYLAR